jgi:hypothetical protein
MRPFSFEAVKSTNSAIQAAARFRTDRWTRAPCITLPAVLP